MIRIRLAVASDLAAASLPATPVAAQDPAPATVTVLEGLTVDAQSGLPFPNVQIRFDSGQRITSDAQGRYTLVGAPSGRHRLALVTGRCNVTFAEIELPEGAIKRVAFSVPSEMVGQGPSPAELKKRSDGAFYSSEELAEMNVRNLLDALQRLAPEMVGPQGAQPGTSGQLMSRTRTVQGVSTPLLVVDGIVVGDAARALRDLRPTDVASLEILKGASRGWEYGTGGAGGVIKVITRGGDVGYGVAHPDRCEIEDWTGRGGIPVNLK